MALVHDLGLPTLTKTCSQGGLQPSTCPQIEPTGKGSQTKGLEEDRRTRTREAGAGYWLCFVTRDTWLPHHGRLCSPVWPRHTAHSPPPPLARSWAPVSCRPGRSSTGLGKHKADVEKSRSGPPVDPHSEEGVRGRGERNHATGEDQKAVLTQGPCRQKALPTSTAWDSV